MSGVKRYSVEYDHHISCCCEIEVDKNGYYVTYEDYMTLLLEYAEYKQEQEAR